MINHIVKLPLLLAGALLVGCGHADRDDTGIFRAFVHYGIDSAAGAVLVDPRLVVPELSGTLFGGLDTMLDRRPITQERRRILAELGIPETDDLEVRDCPGEMVLAITHEGADNCPTQLQTRMALGPISDTALISPTTSASRARFAMGLINAIGPTGKTLMAYQFEFAEDSTGRWTITSRVPFKMPW